MPIITCPSCGEDTFTISGWADVDHCPYCGRPLAMRRVELDPALRAHRSLKALGGLTTVIDPPPDRGRGRD